MNRTIFTIIFTLGLSVASFAQQPDSLSVAVADTLEVPSEQVDTVALPDTVAAPVPAPQPEVSMTREQMLARADALKDVYDFVNARALYDDVLMNEADSNEIARIIALKVQIDNGVGMMDYVMEPTVVARHRFPMSDFFLFYPIPEGSWVASPNALDPTSDSLPTAMYAPQGASRYAWSRNDGASRNIYMTELLDSTWTAPAILRDEFASDGNELWPILSADGKSMYFASNGLYGVGGYDLYVTKLDERTGEWSVPTNLGFPFSSPADDFLYMDTPDEKYTVFASNRSCSADSVDVYVLTYEQLPVRKQITDPVRLSVIASLTPEENASRMDNGDSSDNYEDNADIAKYMNKMEEVRKLRDSLAVATRELNEMRVEFATSNDEDVRASLTDEILSRELALPGLRTAASAAMAELQEIELDFLFKGVVLDPEKLMKKAEREVVGSSTSYTFSRMQYGNLPEFVFEEPEID